MYNNENNVLPFSKEVEKIYLSCTESWVKEDKNEYITSLKDHGYEVNPIKTAIFGLDKKIIKITNDTTKGLFIYVNANHIGKTVIKNENTIKLGASPNNVNVEATHNNEYKTIGDVLISKFHIPSKNNIETFSEEVNLGKKECWITIKVKKEKDGEEIIAIENRYIKGGTHFTVEEKDISFIF
jgi:hypothetical protein